MVRRSRRFALPVWLMGFVALALALGGCGQESAIAVREAWARPAQAATGAMPAGSSHAAMASMTGGSNSAVYLTIANTGGGADTLTGVQSHDAGAVEMHQLSIKDNVASMRQVGEIPIPARGEVRLDPNGYHLILVNVSRDLKAGDTVELTLTFKQAGQVFVTAQVRDQ
jgi:copper(I)-binding protein